MTQKRCPILCLGFPTIIYQFIITQVTPYIFQKKFSPTLSLIAVYLIDFIQLSIKDEGMLHKLSLHWKMRPPVLELRTIIGYSYVDLKMLSSDKNMTK